MNLDFLLSFYRKARKPKERYTVLQLPYLNGHELIKAARNAEDNIDSRILCHEAIQHFIAKTKEDAGLILPSTIIELLRIPGLDRNVETRRSIALFLNEELQKNPFPFSRSPRPIIEAAIQASRKEIVATIIELYLELARDVQRFPFFAAQGSLTSSSIQRLDFLRNTKEFPDSSKVNSLAAQILELNRSYKFNTSRKEPQPNPV